MWRVQILVPLLIGDSWTAFPFIVWYGLIQLLVVLLIQVCLEKVESSETEMLMEIGLKLVNISGCSAIIFWICLVIDINIISCLSYVKAIKSCNNSQVLYIYWHFLTYHSYYFFAYFIVDASNCKIVNLT